MVPAQFLDVAIPMAPGYGSPGAGRSASPGSAAALARARAYGSPSPQFARDRLVDSPFFDTSRNHIFGSNGRTNHFGSRSPQMQRYRY